MTLLAFIFALVALILTAVLIGVVVKQGRDLKDFSELKTKLEKIAEELEAKKITNQIDKFKNITDELKKKTDQNTQEIEGVSSIAHRVIEATKRYLEIVENLVHGKEPTEEVSETRPAEVVSETVEKEKTPNR